VPRNSIIAATNIPNRNNLIGKDGGEYQREDANFYPQTFTWQSSSKLNMTSDPSIGFLQLGHHLDPVTAGCRCNGQKKYLQ